MIEHDHEPIPGLPGVPPAGERILWQGSPDWRVLARTAFHTRAIAGYFAVLAVIALAGAAARGIHGSADLTGTAMTVATGIAGVALLHLLAWWSARTTIYTLTNRRVVLRIGMALPKCINLPIGLIGSVDLTTRADGSGDLPIAITGERRLGYVALWPHARPWKVATPQPMLRGIRRAPEVAALIARACVAAQPGARQAPVELPAEPMPERHVRPAFGEAVAA